MIAHPIRILVIAALFIALVLLFPSNAFAQTENRGLKVVPVTHTQPTSGKQMFDNYCAACHGNDGKGRGPAVEFLKAAPPDLTTMAKRNKGKFPATDFAAVLHFGTGSRAHGTLDMPLWGDVFRSRGGNGVAAIRVNNLAAYVESIQEANTVSRK